MSKTKLKLATFFITVIFIFSLTPAGVSLAATKASGTCGSNLNWSLSDTGTLTISGSGNMDKWMSESKVPWYEYRTSIKSVVFSGNITSIGWNSFKGCSNLSSIRVPDSVTLIENFAFCACTNLKSVNIPSGITNINNATFMNCSSLTSITIPSNVTRIGSGAFEKCTSLTSITIPSKVTYIGTYAFLGCDGLTNITIPNGVTTIEQSAFVNCKNLKTVSIPNSVTSMGLYVFKGCESLTDIYFAGTREKFESFTGYSSIDKSVNIHYGSTAPLSITTQPNDYSGAAGSTATFKVVAQGSGLKYQWQVNKTGTWTNLSMTGANTSTFSLEALSSRNGYKFRCKVTDSTGNSVTSNAVTLKVTTSSLSITTQPKDYSGYAGSTATFKVVAQGSGLKYQWQVNKTGSWVNLNMTGANTATFSLEALSSRNGYKFRCKVTDSTGKSVTSNAVTLSVKTSSLSITTQPKDYSGAAGSKATFKVVAQGSGLKYQWQVNKTGTWTNLNMTGSTSATFTLDALSNRNGYKFRCIVKDSTGSSVTSNVATMYVR